MAPNSRIHALLGARILNFTKLSSNKQEKMPPEQKWNFRDCGFTWQIRI